MEECNFEDLGFSGPEFTWKNGQSGDRLVQERLDRCVATPEWKHFFPNAKVHHMDYWGSDHRAIRLELFASPDRLANRRSGRMGFRFEPWWMKERECVEIITNSWRSRQFDGSSVAVINGLEACATALSKWSRVKFGNITRRVRRIKDELRRLQGGF